MRPRLESLGSPVTIGEIGLQEACLGMRASAGLEAEGRTEEAACLATGGAGHPSCVDVDVDVEADEQ